MGADYPLDVTGHTVDRWLYAVQMLYVVQGVYPMAVSNMARSLHRTTGTLLVVGALSFGAAATVLSATFDWPDILRDPLRDIAAAIRHLLDGKARGKLAVSVSPGHMQATPTGSTS